MTEGFDLLNPNGSPLTFTAGKHRLPPALLDDTADHTTDVGFVAIEQMPQPGILRCFRTAVRLLLEAQDGLFQTLVPFEGGVGAPGVYSVKEKRKITLRTAVTSTR